MTLSELRKALNDMPSSLDQVQVAFVTKSGVVKDIGGVGFQRGMVAVTEKKGK